VADEHTIGLKDFPAVNNSDELLRLGVEYLPVLDPCEGLAGQLVSNGSHGADLMDVEGVRAEAQSVDPNAKPMLPWVACPTR
jgi:hypothetical protein